MANAPFQPDPRFETMLELLDKAMKGDKELLAQIQRRGGFSKEELAPIQEYARRKWDAKLSADAPPQAISEKEMADLKQFGASPEEIADYAKKLSAPTDMGSQYAMFLRPEPKPGASGGASSVPPAPTKKGGGLPKPAGKPKIKPAPASQPSSLETIEASNPDQQAGKAALQMLERIAMPNTVMDPYGRPIDSPAQQLDPTDDVAEISRRIEEGKRMRKQLEESYRRSNEAK